MADNAGKAARGVSLHNHRVRFAEVSDAVSADALPEILPLRFVANFEGGRKCTVDLRQYPIEGVAKQVARILWTETQPAGRLKSPGSVHDTVQAIRRFGEMVVERNLQQRIKLLSDITGKDIDDLETYLYEKYSEESHLPYKRASSFAFFMRLTLAAGLTNENIRERLHSPTKKGMPNRHKPREPYSPFVAEQIRRAALKDIQNIIARITEGGRALIERGQNPYEFGWKMPENIAWVIANLDADSLRLLPRIHKQLQSYREYSGTDWSLRDLIRAVHLTHEDIIPFAIYLSLEIGLPIESIDDLEFDCLHNEARGYADLRYTKRRRGTGIRQVMRVKVNGHFTPGGIIKILKTLTRRTREKMSPAQQMWLFVGHSRTTSKGSEALKRLSPKSVLTTRICERHNIVGDDGKPLRLIRLSRLRKTYKAERYLASPGLASIAGDHTRAVHDRHYANVESLRPVHEQTVADALEQALQVAMEPIVIPSQFEVELRGSTDETGAGIGVTATQLETVSSGRQDVWLASCLDHDNSPLQPINSGPCRSPVWGCLECRNAVITSSKLPALLAFLDHLIERRAHMDLNAWGARYGRAYGRILGSILPRFPKIDIAAARAVASSEGDLMWLPAELTQSR